MSDFDTELMSDFVEEAGGHLTAADDLIKRLDTSPTDAESLLCLYRAFHSIKGVAAFLELEDIEGLAKDAEALMSNARKGSVTFGGDVREAIVQARTLLGTLVGAVKAAIPAGQLPAKEPSVGPLRVRLVGLAA